MFKCDRANTGMGDESALRYAVSWLAWPFLFITCMSVTAYGFSYGDGLMPLLCFNGAYVFLIVSLLCLFVIVAIFRPHWCEIGANGNGWEVFAL